MCRLHKMAYYLASESKEMLTYAIIQVNLEDIMLSEKEADTKGQRLTVRTGGTQNTQIHCEIKQNAGCQGLEGGGNGEVLFNGYRVSVWGNERVLETDGGDSPTIM